MAVPLGSIPPYNILPWDHAPSRIIPLPNDHTPFRAVPPLQDHTPLGLYSPHDHTPSLHIARTVDERTVRVLLECFLVTMKDHKLSNAKTS